uniref:Chitin-binding type-2 domain-containing protein n=1 Tax=Plectus sambesii TaxID=2011161 RepID=A0A914UP60_9BILA
MRLHWTIVVLAAIGLTGIPFADGSLCCDRAHDDISELLHRKDELRREYKYVKKETKQLKEKLRDLIAHQERQWREIEKERAELEQNGLDGPRGEDGVEGPEGDPGQPGDQGPPGKCRDKRMIEEKAIANTHACVSSPSGTLLPNCADCTGETYIECNDNSPSVASCAAGLVWNAALNECDHPSNVINTCPSCSLDHDH